MTLAKSFSISRQMVWAAYLQVKASKGGPGYDNEDMQKFEEDLKNNLYKIWNRMASGTYFPPPVLQVEIPKANGGVRKLGIPTISDRIAQAVVKQYLEPIVEPHFHEDSYGYRPNKSALQAIAQARIRCWRDDWVLDLDIKSFFDYAC
jgi:RNA-directed DNA polymerase